MSILGDNIYMARKGLKLTQGDIAKAAGVSRNAISLFESGQLNPSAVTLAKVAVALNKSPEDLLPVPELPVTRSSHIHAVAPQVEGEARWRCEHCGHELAFSQPIEMELMLRLIKVFSNGHSGCITTSHT
jgi:transcriptional regulator with XRE-family HTH domain